MGSVTNPARIAIDLPNIANGTGKTVIDIAQGDVRTVNVVEAGNRTRLVINLSRALSYVPNLDGNALTLAIEGVSQGVLKDTAQVTRFAEPSPATTSTRHAVRDVDFRRGSNGHITAIFKHWQLFEI